MHNAVSWLRPVFLQYPKFYPTQLRMNKEDFDNDEPIHHFEGKELLHSCPSKPPGSNLSGQHKEPKIKNQSKVKRILAKVFKRNNSKQQISITVLNFNGNIVFEDSTLIDESTIIEALTKNQQEKQL